MHRLAPLLALAAACTATPEHEPTFTFGYSLDTVLRLNHVQLKGTHNSYHLRPENPISNTFDYSHVPLTEQLEKQGVRQFELDVHWLPEEERFAVFHIPSVDDRSTCHYLTDCIGEIRAWSDAHRGHQPLWVFIEPKDDVDPFDAKIAPQLDNLDAEVRRAWPDRMLTPDALLGAHANLAEAVAQGGWPTLGAWRGGAVFVLLDPGRAPGEPLYEYTHGLKDLRGRAMFATGDDGDPFAAVRSLEHSKTDGAEMEAAARKGVVVRTLVDDGHGDHIEGTADRDAALKSASHIISSDYPVKGVVPGYDVDLEGGTPSRCHPVTAPTECTPLEIESPDRLQPLKAL